jgi:hypothetical protein
MRLTWGQSLGSGSAGEGGTATRRCTRRCRWERRARWRPRRAMCGSGSFTGPLGRCLDGWAARKTSGAGARRRWQPWAGGGALVVPRKGGGGVPSFYSPLVLAKVVRARQSTGTSRYGRWPPATSVACTAATTLGGWRGRRGLAMVRAARGAREVGEGGGATHGRSTACGLAGQSRPPCAVWRCTGGLRGARIATSYASARALALGAPAQFDLGLFNCEYL